jgi:polyisoprenoid-binding protein YceI
MNDTPDTPETSRSSAGGFPRWLKWGLLGALTILIVGYGAIFLYAKVINDSPDALDTDDLGAALETETADASPGTGQDATPAGAGVWNITQASELGYRIKEVLFGVDSEAVGRTNQISGSFTIDGTQVTDGAFVVDVAEITSDDGRRDGQFRNRIMSTDEFPTATFTLTAPIELGLESAEGAEVETTATGDLTLRGVTNSVTFDVTARQADGKIGVLGNIPIVFADYSIANPSVSGISTEDHGLLEFVLVFEPA